MIEANATYEGKPIEVLNQLIKERSEYLNQSVKKSAIAVAINALKSLRAQTNDARKNRKFKIEIEETQYNVGFDGNTRRLCLRNGPLKTSPRVFPQERVVFNCRGLNNPTKQAQVYRVKYEKLSIKPFLIACPSKNDALTYALKATKLRIDEKGSLAKNALGVAMAKLASKTKLDGSQESKSLASTLSAVIERTTATSYYVKVTDGLEYATNALKSGEAALEKALQSAANKVYGMLVHLGDRDLSERMPSKPFPEVNKGKI